MIKSLPNARTLKILDYGCGQGGMVRLLREEGMDCYGVEVCYEGANFDEFRKSDLYRQGILREIPVNGEVPFEDGFFDIILSNQVFEHIADKRTVLRNLKRVLNDNGFMYHHFPSREVMREGHIGIPFAHWLPKGKFRYAYTAFLRSLGFGYYKQNKSIGEWTRFELDWIDSYCFYEPYKSLQAMLDQDFVIAHREIEYCRFRARNNTLLRSLLNIKPMAPVYQRLFRRLGFMALHLTKKPMPARPWQQSSSDQKLYASVR
jgi:SAM-dependent methyltransferase